MKTVGEKEIKALNILDSLVIEWVKDAFMSKKDFILPKKTSLTFNNGQNFYNTMPAMLPSLDAAGVKIVSRYPGRTPSIGGHLLLYSYETGDFLAVMEAAWITAARTGAVAALAVETFAKKSFETVAITGFGQTGLSFIDMFLSNPENIHKTFKLKSYKNYADKVSLYLTSKGVYNIQICDTDEEFIKDSDVIVSAVTVAEHHFGKDEWYKEGVLVVPIHTRGFQNCDLFFDKVFGDDIDHVRGFQHFEKFKTFGEISDVLTGAIQGRENDSERILSYNIGIALHDLYLARRIYDLLD